MGKVFEIQTYLRISASYTGALSGTIASSKIKYVDPDDVEGEWVASHDPASRTFYYDTPAGSPLTKTGFWRAWTYVTFDDGRILVGEMFRFRISREGT